MNAPLHTVEQIIERLDRLWKKLDEDGRYTDADTAMLAVSALRTGFPAVHSFPQRSTAARTDVQGQPIGASDAAATDTPATAPSTIEECVSPPAGIKPRPSIPS